MEADYTSEFEPRQDLSLTASAKSDLLKTSRWAKIMSIAGFLLVGFFLLAAIGIFFVYKQFEYMEELDAFGLGFIMPMALVFGLLSIFYLYPLIKLYRFSTFSKSAVNNNDTFALERAMSEQKQLFTFLGIITIVVISIYVLMFLFNILLFSSSLF